MNRFRHSSFALGFSSLLLAGTSPLALAWAADAPQAPASADQVEEVVVTAQKRKESVQDVPASISVLNGQDLVDNDVKTINDLPQLVPNFEVEPAFGSGQPVFRIRGVGFDDYAANNAPTVGIYIDQVAHPVPITTQGQLFDLERVEVLRGPQGTLYGRNTTGGAVNFITADPTAVLSAGATAEYGRFGDTKIDAFASGPVSDRFRLRLAFQDENGGAWQKDRATGEELGNKDRQAARLKGDIDVTDDLTVKFTLHGSRDQSDGWGGHLLTPDTAPVPPLAPTVPADSRQTATGWGLSPTYAAMIDAKSGKPFKDNTGYGFNATVEQNFGAVKLTDIAAYDGFNRREFEDWDATSANQAGEYFHTNTRVISDELRLSSNAPSSLQWVGGLYYSNEKIDERFLSDFTDEFGFYTRTLYKQTANTYSGFGQLDYAVTDKLKLIGGLRYEREDRDLDNYTTFIIVPGAATTGGTPASFSTGMNKLSGKVGIEYQLAQPVLLYATASRGVKSGGFSTYNTPTPELAGVPFQPEKVLTYETGFKSDLIDRKLRLNADVFYSDYRDQQVQSAVWNTSYGLIGTIVNAPKSNIKGGEVELDAKPIRGLTITQGLGYSRGEYDEYQALDSAASTAASAAVYTNYKGRDLGFPKLTYSGAVSYEIIDREFSVVPRVTYYYRSKQTSNWGPAYDIEPYWLVNASITVSPLAGPWSVAVFGQNILNKKYDLTRNFFVDQRQAVGWAGIPATYGVRLSYKY